MASGKTAESQGRVNEAGGALTGDEAPKQEGRNDQAAGKPKEKAEKTLDHMLGDAQFP